MDTIRGAGVCALLLAGLCRASAPAAVAPDHPSVTIANGLIDATVMLPDPVKGYYRGCRFDWSGMVARVRYKGHTFFAPWKTPHRPTDSECAIGTADEYGMGTFGMPAPIGYEQAKVGEPFLKVGVGLVAKEQERRYRFGRAYRIVRPGTWQVSCDKTSATFVQSMAHPGGWAYRYTKRIVVAKGRPRLTIHRSLRNTGTRPIHQTQYCHNFLIVDDRPIGTAYVVRFPFAVKTNRRLKDVAAARGSEIVFLRDMKPREAIFSDLSGFTGDAAHNRFTVARRKAGVGVHVTGSLPLVQFHFFATRTTVCPEPFVEVKAAPGQEVAWRADYDFFVNDPSEAQP